MIKRLYTTVILLIICSGCRHPSAPTTAVHSAAAKMNGLWIGIGSGYETGQLQPPDAFFRFKIITINDSTLVCGDTLKYKWKDASSGIMFFEYYYAAYSMHPRYSRVYYNVNDNSIKYENAVFGSSGQTTMEVFTSKYKPSKSLRNYLPSIVGTKILAGTVYDTNYMRRDPDSMYTVNATIAFVAVDDSTYSFSPNILGIGDTILHYKCENTDAKTVTFQTFHDVFCSFSTLTYNYDTHSIVFEQRDAGGPWDTYMKLQ